MADDRPILRAHKPMTLGELRTALSRILDDAAVEHDSIVVVEGWNDEGDFIQGCIESVSTEARCEEDDERQAVYINLLDEAGDGDEATAKCARGPCTEEARPGHHYCSWECWQLVEDEIEAEAAESSSATQDLTKGQSRG